MDVVEGVGVVAVTVLYLFVAIDVVIVCILLMQLRARMWRRIWHSLCELGCGSGIERCRRGTNPKPQHSHV